MIDFIGQEKLIRRLNISIKAAKSRQASLGHTLLDGPPGLGKTTLAEMVAKEFDSQLTQVNAGAIVSQDEMLQILCGLKRLGFLFLDEIHRLPPSVQESIYTALENRRVDQVAFRLWLPSWCCVGATTHVGLLSAPLRARFPIRGTFTYYNSRDLARMIPYHAPLLPLSVEGMKWLGSRSRGTPRTLVSYLHWLRDYVASEDLDCLGLIDVREAMEIIGIDDRGLSENDRIYLAALRGPLKGGPAGIESLASSTSLAKETIVDDIEPYLLRLGLITRTPRGRKCI